MSGLKLTYLRCDEPGCALTFGGVDEPVRVVRRRAREHGWSHRTGHPAAPLGTPAAGGDFCPDHTPDRAR